MKIVLKTSDLRVGTICIQGPDQCGKSIVADRIIKMLKSEFGVEAIINNERKEDWKREMVKKTLGIYRKKQHEID